MKERRREGRRKAKPESWMGCVRDTPNERVMRRSEAIEAYLMREREGR